MEVAVVSRVRFPGVEAQGLTVSEVVGGGLGGVDEGS